MSDRIRIIKRGAVPKCGSYEVRFSNGRPSKYFYWEEAAGEEGAAPKNNSQAAEVAMSALVDLVIYIVLIGLVCGLLIWWLDRPGPGSPNDFTASRASRSSWLLSPP